jgi:hypothetical protein
MIDQSPRSNCVIIYQVLFEYVDDLSSSIEPLDGVTSNQKSTHDGVSNWQVLSHPSPSIAFPSSHSSHPSTTELPHSAGTHVS